MSKSILVIDEEELTFLKQITNHFTNYNTSKAGVSVVNKIRNAQDTTELLEALSKVFAQRDDLAKVVPLYNKLVIALGGQDE